jgi:hypothetical protein
MIVHWSVAIVLALVFLAWTWQAPDLWFLAAIVCGPLELLVFLELTEMSGADAYRRRTERFRGGRCCGCGYDLRGSAERCPECARPRDRPDLPLPRGDYSSSWGRDVAWLLELREPTSPQVWADDERARIARVIAGACRRGACWPTDHFIPDDPFAVMIEDWEGMGWFDVSVSVERELHLRLSTDDYAQMREMTFCEIVDYVARRTIATSGRDAATRGDPSHGLCPVRP